MAEQETSTATAQPQSAAWDPVAERKQNGMHPGGLEYAPHQSTVSQVARPEFMKLGNPGPLGLLSFAITTFVVGLYECGAGYEWFKRLSCSLLACLTSFADSLNLIQKALLAPTKLLLEL